MRVFELIRELSQFDPNEDVYVRLEGSRDEFDDCMEYKEDDMQNIEGYVDEVSKRKNSYKQPSINCTVW